MEVAYAPKNFHRITFTFLGEQKPCLERIDFIQKGQTESTFVDRGHKTHPLKWTKLTKALTLCFLEYAEWGRSKRNEKYFFRGARTGSLAATLGDAIGRAKHEPLMDNLFFFATATGTNFNVVRQIFECDRGYNVHGKDKNNNQRRIPINLVQLPPEGVLVFQQVDDNQPARELQNLEKIQDLIDEVRKSCGLEKRLTRIIPGCVAQKSHSFSFDYDRYAQAIVNLYGTLEFHDPHGFPSFTGPIALFNVFVPQVLQNCDAYSEASIEQFANASPARLLADEVMWGVHDLSDNNETVRNVLEVLNDLTETRIVLLGKCGSGKTSLLKYAAINWTKKIDRGAANIIPIVVELRAFLTISDADKANLDIIKLLGQGIGTIYKFGVELLKGHFLEGKACVYFDGLEEVYDESLRSATLSAIVQMASEYPRLKIVITSRHTGYLRDIRTKGFRHYLIKDYDKRQISTFVTLWNAELKRMGKHYDLKRQQNQFLEKLIRHDPLIDFCGSPKLLTTLLHERVVEPITSSRYDFLKRCADLYLNQLTEDMLVLEKLFQT